MLELVGYVTLIVSLLECLGLSLMTSFLPNVGFMHLVAWLVSESRGNSHINVSSFP